ncbi:type I-F CRISPR-associated protein Csy1 [Colibacter massiliensis]|uniref:type I-F CRISPR-associated protein Csy1 n=1 Tax=Colibacter massiliensis TaxID=1852379 RepID=UPI00235635A0|nr:type I-F CRISPR-associated protein Csy1 [Colibacter massiliensis]
MSILEDFIVKKAKEKKLNIKDWLERCINGMTKCKRVTHVGKFSHPETDVVYLYTGMKTSCKEYVTSDTVDYPTDISYDNAIVISSGMLLDLALEDGKRMLDHVLTQDLAVKAIIENLGGNYQLLYSNVKKMGNLSFEYSDGRLKQVYFPINKDYHLLTVLPSSGILIELYKRIQRMQKQESEKKEEKRYSKLLNLTTMSIGGDNPRNISLFNHQNRGNVTLLASLPPDLVKRTIRLPKQNFWNEAIPYNQYIDLFYALHEIFLLEQNNLRIRKKRDVIVAAIIDVVMCIRLQLLQEPEGWSDRTTYKHLPLHQKKWLDRKYDKNETQEGQIQKLSDEFSRWLIKTYERIVNDYRLLGNAEFDFFAKCMRDILTEEVISKS